MAGYIKHKQIQLAKRERGNILVMFTIGLFVLLAMAALAIDGGHLLLNKSRLQNIADAAALHAAKTLDEGGSHQDARAAVIEIIGLNLAHRDNHEINDALDLSAVNVDFSESSDPFVSSVSNAARYVKVEINNLNLNNFLADIMSFSKRVSATSLAGPSTAIEDCPADVVPLVICGDPDNELSGSFKEVGEGGEDIYNEGRWGLDFAALYALKIGSATTSAIGPGNFQFLDFPGDLLKNQMAGGVSNDLCDFNSESIDEYVVTKPGNTVSVAKGVNTRFGSYTGEFSGTADEYPRDWNTCQGQNKVEVYTTQEAEAATAASATSDNPIVYQAGDINPDTINNAYRYSQYKKDIGDGSCSNIVDDDGNTVNTIGSIDKAVEWGQERRRFNIVIADCSGVNNGKTALDQLDLGCFFLTQEMIQKGNEAYIVGELVKECYIEGSTDGIAADNPGPHKIVLYHVPGSQDS